MAEDWSADVRRYDPDAPESVIAGIVRYCGIALRKRDSSLVSFGDPVEIARVRDNFLKKKLGLTQPDSDLDAAIVNVGQRMKGDNFKNRVTVYYLLTRQFGQEALFDKNWAPGAGSTAGSGAAAVGAAGLGAGAAGLAALGRDDAPPPPPSSAMPVDPVALKSAAPVEPRPAETTHRHAAEPVAEEREGGAGWLWWLLGLVLLGLLLWWLFTRNGSEEAATTAPVATETVSAMATTADTVDLTAAPAEGSVTIPEGAGVTTEVRAGKPVVKVYFNTGTTDIAPAFGPAAAALKTWLDANPGSSLAISGFNDPTGNAAANAELAKNRAGAVRAALVSAGIVEARTEMVKPADATDGDAALAAARRVEVVVR